MAMKTPADDSAARVSSPPADPVDERSALGPAACLFRGLGDPARLTILRHLALGEHRVVELTEHVNLAQSTVSKHLACLLDCGLVHSRPHGRSSIYSLTQPDLTNQLFRAAEGLLAATGDAVTLCPTYGVAAASDDACPVDTSSTPSSPTRPGT